MYNAFDFILMGQMTRELKSGIAAYCAIFGIGYMGYMLMPALLAAVIQQLEINEAQAGMAGTIQLGGLALALFTSTLILGRINVRSLILLGTVVAIAGLTLTTFANSFAGVLMGLGPSGVGMGMVLAGGNTLVASAKSPDKMFATILALGQATAILILITVLPVAVGSFGFQGGFGAVALWTAFMGSVLFFTTPRRYKEAHKAHADRNGLLIFSTPVVLAFLLLGLADASVWPFSQQIGSSLGLGPGTAESVIAAALAAGVIGSFAAAWLGMRLGRVLPMVMGVFILACSYYQVLNASAAWVYALAQITVVFAYGFSIPYFFGLCCVLDSSGRYMSAGAGMQMTGLALAPWIAGSLIVKSGYSVLGIAVVISVGLALVLGLSSVRKVNVLLSQ